MPGDGPPACRSSSAAGQRSARQAKQVPSTKKYASGAAVFNTNIVQTGRGRDWMGRATAEVELGLKLSKKITTAHSVPDAITAYQEWLSDEMGARAEDTRLLMSSWQKFMDASSRLLSSNWMSASTTT